MFISAMILMREMTRGLQPARRRLLIVEHAVDPVADAQRVLERLDVDVGGLGADRVLDEQVDQPDDRRLERHVAQVVDVLVAAGAAVVLHALDDALQRRGRAVVDPVDGLGDGRPGLTTILTLRPVAWRSSSAMSVLSGSAEATVSVLPSRLMGHTRVWRRYLAETFLRTGTDEGNLLAPHVGQVLLQRQRAQHVVLGHRPERDESFADQLAARLRARERALHDVGRREPFLHEDFAEKAGGRCDRHVMLAASC